MYNQIQVPILPIPLSFMLLSPSFFYTKMKFFLVFVEAATLFTQDNKDDVLESTLKLVLGTWMPVLLQDLSGVGLAFYTTLFLGHCLWEEDTAS